MKYADVKKLYQMLAKFNPDSLKGIYDEYMLETLFLSYKDVMQGLEDYLEFWDFELKEK